MKGFLVYPTYRIINDKPYIYLFGRLSNGESFLTINHADPYFYIKAADLAKATKLLTAEDPQITSEESKSTNKEGSSVVKIIVQVPKHVPILRKKFEEAGILCYEADIRFVYAYLMDKNIKGCLTIEGNYKVGQYVNRIYEDPKIERSDPYDVDLKVLSLDIETDPTAANIFSIALYTDNYKKVLFVQSKKHKKDLTLKHADVFADEKSMLEAFQQKIIELDPDIITGWHVIEFDWKVLRDRFKHYHVPMIFGRAEWEANLRIESDFFKESSIEIAGRQVLDGITLLKDNFIRLDDYKLDTAAHVFLGKKKELDFKTSKKSKPQEIEERYYEDPQSLVDYNLMDAQLVMEILQKQELISLTIQRSMLTGMQLDRVSAAIASFDSLYLRETKKRGIVCPCSQYTESEERIKGGYVRESLPGIYDFIIVCDFKSLYPSIIRTFNIDPMRYVLHPKEQTKEKDLIIAPNGAAFQKEEGILPGLIHDLWDMRDRAKKQKNQTASYAIKITMNSMFGVLANPACRFYSLEIANAITSFGREIVQESAKIVEGMKYTVIYGDTDSLFIDAKTTSFEETKKIGKHIAEHINAYYKKHVKEKHNRESHLELQFEKIYKRFIMPKVRHFDTGAKKRYAGLLIAEEDGKLKEKMEFVGLEVVRRDWTELAKQFQRNLLERIFKHQEIQPYIKEFVHELNAGKHDALLIYVKALRKPVSFYTKTTPPHVKAAKMLETIDSRLIRYILTVEGPQPIQKLSAKPDYEHYIDKQLKPIADAILVFFNESFDDVVKGKKQRNLFEF